MASSGPNPYGQSSQAPPPPAGHADQTSAGQLYYSDYNQITASDHLHHAQQQQSHYLQQQQQQAQRLRQPLMSHPDGLDKLLGSQTTSNSPLLLHSSSLAASYDPSYSLGGMSSDSELTTPSATGRHHHHHHHHHRPYSSQSRVYHAHPVPRPVHATPPQSQRGSHYSTSPASSTSSGAPPLASSGNPSYLPPTAAASSSESPQARLKQPQPSQQIGRQLPQRPFKQSMSIDHQAAANHQQYAQLLAGHSSPAHQRFYQTTAGRTLEMDLLGQQAASMSLYEQQPPASGLAELPPVGARSSSATAGGGGGRANLVDPFQQQQQKILQQSSQDPYANAQGRFERQADWLPPPAPPTSGSSRPRDGSGQQQQFKQTMSIDHYPASKQHQAHYSPARHFGSNEHFRLEPYNQQQQQQLASYYAPSGITQVAGQQQLKYQTQQQHLEQTMQVAGANEQQQQQQPQVSKAANFDRTQTTSGGGGRPQLQQQQSSSSGSNSNLSGSLKSGAFEAAGHGGAMANQNNNLATGYFSQQDNGAGKQTISGSNAQPHYQQSPQHYNNNNNNNSGKPPTHAAANYHPTSGQQFSALHHNVQGSKQDNLRRGYTSLSSASYCAELGGSQGALSESSLGGVGDHSLPLSLSQANYGGGGGGQLVSKRAAAMRAASPSMGFEGAPVASGSGQQQQHHNQAHYQHHSTSSSHGREAPSGSTSSAQQQQQQQPPLGPVGMRSESSTGLPNGSSGGGSIAGATSSGGGGGAGSSTLTKKSNSATQLSMTGTKKRLGFRKKQVTSFSVHRSEEVAPLEARHLVKQGSSVSEGDSSMSGDSSSRSWSNSNFKAQTSEELASMSFIDGLGKGQMISRQGLASPYLGDIQLSLCDRRGNLEIEVIRARNLQAKTNKIQPLTYVKLYLVKNRKCLGKAKTTLSNKRTLNPLFQQQLTFHEDYHGCILQSIVWGNFGKMDKKNFMGIAQISIDDLELSDTVISWYKLFLPSSLQTLPSKSLRHTLLSNSTESFTNTNNS